MIDLEREHLRKTYQLCRTGFFFLAVALVPASVIALLAMVGLLGDMGLFRRIVNSPWNQWVSTVSVWASLVGTMLLWAPVGPQELAASHRVPAPLVPG